MLKQRIQLPNRRSSLTRCVSAERDYSTGDVKLSRLSRYTIAKPTAVKDWCWWIEWSRQRGRLTGIISLA